MKRRSFLGVVAATPLAVALARVIDLDALPPLPKPPPAWPPKPNFTGQIGSFTIVSGCGEYVAMCDRYYNTRIGRSSKTNFRMPTKAEKLAAQDEFRQLMLDAKDESGAT